MLCLTTPACLSVSGYMLASVFIKYGQQTSFQSLTWRLRLAGTRIKPALFSNLTPFSRFISLLYLQLRVYSFSLSGEYFLIKRQHTWSVYPRVSGHCQGVKQLHSTPPPHVHVTHNPLRASERRKTQNMKWRGATMVWTLTLLHNPGFLLHYSDLCGFHLLKILEV